MLTVYAIFGGFSLKMLQKAKSITSGEDFFKIEIPRHIAITMDGIEAWALKNKVSLEEANRRSFLILRSAIKSQVKLNIPILTFYMLSENVNKNSESYDIYLNSINSFFEEVYKSDIVNENKIKISFLGKWYHLPGRVIETIKKVIDGTKDYDSFFLNFCVNYDGQEEIVDAFKLIARQIKAGKLDPELIDKDLVKENLYSSYFLPPDLMIKNGGRKETSGILLWDSPKSKVYFTNKNWPDFDKTEFMDAIKDYQKGG